MKWHYTTLPRLKQILASGYLKPSSYEGERPAVWFSSNQTFEQTARKRINNMSRRLTFIEMAHLIGLARVGVERDDLLTYGRWGVVGKVSPELATSLVLGGLELGADPHEWFASFEPVLSQDWRSVQVFDLDRWVNLEEVL